MSKRFIRIEGLLVEVEESDSNASAVADDDNTRTIRDGDLGQIRTTLTTIVRHLKDSWGEINQDMRIKEADVEISLGFEAEGNIFVAKGKASSQLKVTLKLEPTEQ